MRVLNTAINTALQSRHIRMCYLVEAAFPTGVINFTTTPFSIDHAGKEWLGAGRMLDIQFASEDSTLQAHSAEITLDGMDAAAISQALNEPLENTPIAIYALVWDQVSNGRLGHFLVFWGTISEIKIIPPSSREQ